MYFKLKFIHKHSFREKSAKEKAAAEAAAQSEAASLTYELEADVTYEAEITDVSSQMELEQEGEEVDSTNTSTQMEVEEPDNDNNSLQMDLDTSIAYEQLPLTTPNTTNLANDSEASTIIITPTPSNTSSSSDTFSPFGNGFPTPINLHLVRKPFKNPHYKTPKKFKTLKQILAAERNLNTPLDVPTYSNIEAPPSIRPQKKYCDITGLEAKYTDPKTRLRYHSAEVYKEIKQLAPGVIQDYLGLRHAAVVLR
ncbi:hypothetical protein RclHR1_07140008 [Rhizophagus clarus]|uniref:Ino80 complex subunit Ies6 n=1 Tax=Rhizophagus clarus TaxID=94130 RepID=A0A2Z6RXE1_9GLOM|nr:hypothetical protein RclHR1_07140008 [Rhizophagus clarus]GES73600.1 Ino80 complex subunit Ies6 [Rhizophagus clarus]GES87146.1 Ino80 complex subunit Ies6 [Rhizophagus clarus]